MSFRPFCPICGGTEFLDFNTRQRVRCAACHSMERTRLLWLLLERTGGIRPGMKVLHFAPETGLSRRLKFLASEYVSADFDVSQYKNFLPNTLRIDLCDIDPELAERQFDLIIHMHVLEHLPCAVGGVLANLTRMLTPGGRMYFAVPIRRDARSEEDLDPDLPPQERRRRFGQSDHVRMLGSIDAISVLSEQIGDALTALEATDFLSERELALHALPVLTGLHSSTIFLVEKRG